MCCVSYRPLEGDIDHQLRLSDGEEGHGAVTGSPVKKR